MGLTATATSKTESKVSTGKSQKNFMSVKKLTDAPTRLLKEVDIN